MVIFRRRLKGFLPDISPHLINRDWQIDMETRERAYAKRHAMMGDRMDNMAKTLPPLSRGTEVAVQDPGVNGKPGRWTKTGTIVECLPYNAYMVRIHGSRAVTQRNRVHIRKILPFAPEEYILPVNSKEAAEVPERTKTEVTDRYVVVQPPQKFMRLSPDKHRKSPVAPPGQDAVTALKREESEQKVVSDVWDEIPTWRDKQ